MRTLIIGGTVFMGREIAERLAARGDDVTVLHRGPDHQLNPAIHNLQADRADLDALTRMLADGHYDAVFDLAYDWQRGTSAQQVESAARSCGDQLRRYVFVSSIAAYGPGLDHRETDPLVADDFPNPYAQHKASSERALFRLQAERGVPVTTFRPPFVHGPRQPFYREQFFWDRLLDRRPIILPDNGEAPIQWVFAADVAEACIRAVDVPGAAGEAFNLAHSEPLTQRTYIEALARTAGVEPTFVSIPREVIHAAGGHPFMGHLYFGEFLDVPVHTSLLGKASRILGVTPTPLATALQASFEWYQAQPRRPVDYAFEDGLLVNAPHAPR
jgi:nucleoside-diphosphate-sugar epimerase